MSSPPILSVSELNRLARLALEKALPSCWVAGEISNLSRAASGHWYFTLKDAQAGGALAPCPQPQPVRDWQPREGDRVEVRAQPTLYEARGDYQLIVEAMRRAGAGALFEAFLRLKAKLEQEGLFAPERKRALPPYPRSHRHHHLAAGRRPARCPHHPEAALAGRRRAALPDPGAGRRGARRPARRPGPGRQPEGMRGAAAGARRRQSGRPVGLQRRGPGARHRRQSDSGGLRRRPRDRFHHRRLRRRSARPHPHRRRPARHPRPRGTGAASRPPAAAPDACAAVATWSRWRNAWTASRAACATPRSNWPRNAGISITWPVACVWRGSASRNARGSGSTASSNASPPETEPGRLARTAAAAARRAGPRLGRPPRAQPPGRRQRASRPPQPQAVRERGYSITRDAQGCVVRDGALLAEGERLDLTFARGGASARVTRER